jgi:hypothetical protein
MYRGKIIGTLAPGEGTSFFSRKSMDRTRHDLIPFGAVEFVSFFLDSIPPPLLSEMKLVLIRK